MKVARIVVSTEIILDALAFPKGAKVKACMGERAPLGEIELFVEHDDLPDVAQGHEIPQRVPTITTTGEPPAAFFAFDWGKEVEPEETAVLRRFYDDVCRRAEHNMEKTGKLEGAHYAAMRSVLAERGVGL